ncbi:CARDB domain-containing protein [Streptomyces canus]|uniref:CARDB domain-containing protein n=1 Tax=Streptomyces canus TaxID=58343 RepID=UPI002E37CBD5|nr:CARDB domain-containing protein [Streptomyces canus]
MGSRGAFRQPVWLILIILLSASCSGDRQIDPRHSVLVEYVPVPLSEELTVKEASCRAGDVLLGAGHRVDRVEVSLHNAVAVVENRPSSSGTWRLVVQRRPGMKPSEAIVSLYLYCLHRSGGSPAIVSAHVAAGLPVGLTPSGGVATGSASVRCPSGRTLTAGGFAVGLPAPDPSTPATYNAWVVSSQPARDLRSWDLSGSFIRKGSGTPRITPYAMCISDPAKVLKPSAAGDVEAQREERVNFGLLSGAARCPGRGFATGGGFSLSGDELVPRSILQNQATLLFTGWRVRGVYGFQTGGSESLTVRPLCFEPVDLAAPDQIDLLPLLGADPLRTSGCPGGAKFCFDFTVVNAGTVVSPATVADVTALNAAAVRVSVPSLGPGESTELTAVITNPCSNDCSAGVTVDTDDDVTESDESNNSAQWSVVG